MVDDILTCGVCFERFPLADILRFMNHKMRNCVNKENCSSRKAFGLNGSSHSTTGSNSEPSSPRGVKRRLEDDSDGIKHIVDSKSSVLVDDDINTSSSGEFFYTIVSVEYLKFFFFSLVTALESIFRAGTVNCSVSRAALTISNFRNFV